MRRIDVGGRTLTNFLRYSLYNYYETSSTPRATPPPSQKHTTNLQHDYKYILLYHFLYINIRIAGLRLLVSWFHIARWISVKSLMVRIRAYVSAEDFSP